MKLNDYIVENWNSGKIKRQKKLGDKRILLLSLKGVSPRKGSKNLLAVDRDNNVLWTAELPTELYDSYYDMKYENGIIYGRSSNSYIAEINPDTGEILKKYMVK